MSNDSGIRFLLNLENRFESFMLGVIKLNRKNGLIHQGIE